MAVPPAIPRLWDRPRTAAVPAIVAEKKEAPLLAKRGLAGSLPRARDGWEGVPIACPDFLVPFYPLTAALSHGYAFY